VKDQELGDWDLWRPVAKMLFDSLEANWMSFQLRLKTLFGASKDVNL